MLGEKREGDWKEKENKRLTSKKYNIFHRKLCAEYYFVNILYGVLIVLTIVLVLYFITCLSYNWEYFPKEKFMCNGKVRAKNQADLNLNPNIPCQLCDRDGYLTSLIS